MPGSTNILQFDAPLNNAETDANYAADSIRINGAAPGGLWPSPLSNKAFYQWSAVCAALGQALALKGYVVNDAPFSSLVAVFGHILTDADIEGSLINVPFASSMSFDAHQSKGFSSTLTGNPTTTSLINTTAGLVLTFILTQDSAGGRVFPWPSQITTSAICPLPNSISIQQFQVLLGGTQVIPLTAMLWISANGTIIPQPFPTVLQINANGNISNQYGMLTEEVNCSAGSITRYLPTAVGYAGLTINVKRRDVSGNSLTVAPAVAGQTIDGFSNYGINPYWSIEFQSDGTNWIII